MKGAAHFSEQQIIQASGLALGQTAHEADFKLASQKLGDTGLFSQVTYSYHYSPAGCDLELQVTENDQLVPAHFDNFVWFRDDELIGLIRAQLPLFDGRLPLGGNFPDQVASALSSILALRKIAGEVAYDRSSDDNGRVTSYVYKLNFHPIEIQSVDFPGAGPSELQLLQEASKPLLGTEYLRSRVRSQENSEFLPVFLSRGYLKAHFEDAQASVVKDEGLTRVAVSLPVVPGAQYKLTQISWTGKAALPASQLQSEIHLKPGEPADAVRLQQDLQAVLRLYGSKGYVDARITPVAQFDDAQSTVQYQLNVSEGDLYRMGDLQIDGIDAATVSRILAQWQMKKGDPYDNTYVHRFFDLMYRDTGLHHSYSIIPKPKLNPQDKTVSIALHFVPK